MTEIVRNNWTLSFAVDISGSIRSNKDSRGILEMEDICILKAFSHR